MYENVFYTGEYTIKNNVLLYRASLIRKALSFAARFILTLRMMVIFMLKVKRPFDAYLDEMNKITILLPHAYGTSRTFRLQEGSNVKRFTDCSYNCASGCNEV